MGRCLFLAHRRFNTSQINDVTLLQAVGAQTGQSWSSRKKDKLPKITWSYKPETRPSMSSYIKHLSVLNFFNGFQAPESEYSQ